MISFINPLHNRVHRQVAPSTPSPSSTSPPKSSPHSHSLSRQQQQQQHQQQQHNQFYQTKDQLHPDQNDNKPRYYSIFSELTTQVDQRERALQQFPCEERHSYNPHYQHNLVSSSPTYSSSPSLCPSSVGSSPSSAYSSNSSNSSLSRATGARVLTQEQSNKQQQDHHYYRHYNRRQNQRHYAYQQQNEHYHDDWMFGISEDDSYNGGASMACAQPQDALVIVASSSSKTSSLSGSLRSSISRRVSDGSLSVATQISAKNRRPTVTFSPVVFHHPAPGQKFTALLSSSFASSSQTSSGPAKLLPSIAESSIGLNSSTTMATAKAESTMVAQNLQQQQPVSAGRMTAKQSLMRIAQLSKDQDGWCSHKAGQYTQGYAEARSRGMKLDGRRARRL
ncbi:hypothetical protein K457DRAFT_892541 [Linnemannia elongata AG-77]|uniref:Uncharacterized protein n=1 Tax=Linnemannia elongata AG-77 TaxID=1314771 RepID=A0A197K069_9FUNG|nr:hypothetical protein K457DRAFT_892541 [Linnemannia elongata AG-77]